MQASHVALLFSGRPCASRFEPSGVLPNQVGSCFLSGTLNSVAAPPGRLTEQQSGWQPQHYANPPLLRGNPVFLPTPGATLAANLAPASAGG